MLLAIDIGNTNTTFGVFKGRKIIKRFNIPTHNFNSKTLKRNLGLLYLDDAVICSVVPKVTLGLVKALKKFLSKPPRIIGKEIAVPIKNLYRKPRQVGQDRLVNAYAAITLYSVPSVIVDFGTAITIDVVSKNEEYLGGLILPGLRISLETLHQKTALLPKIKLNEPKEFIARDTSNSMLSGIVHGFACMTDELVRKLKVRMGWNTVVIGTGGDIDLIGKFCTQLDKIDRDLTLEGLNLVYKQMQELNALKKELGQ